LFVPGRRRFEELLNAVRVMLDGSVNVLKGSGL
jgi:hypothetical protein